MEEKKEAEALVEEKDIARLKNVLGGAILEGSVERTPSGTLVMDERTFLRFGLTGFLLGVEKTLESEDVAVIHRDSEEPEVLTLDEMAKQPWPRSRR